MPMLAEFVASENSPITQKPIREFNFPEGITMGGLIRDNVGMSIGGNTQIMPGDRVVVFGKSGLIYKIDSYFAAPVSAMSRIMSALRS